MISERNLGSTSKDVLRDTEFGDLCKLDQITSRYDWPLKMVRGTHVLVRTMCDA
jgi:hypothetical protein